ncbi:MAG: superoxide dismutase [Candidatus Gracilibacteria bacterium]|nr:superoxide dismutase [Candidatus Gracilibacteria bacterium]
MKFELIKLNYDFNGLKPYISEETMEYHYSKHHRTYVDNLNKLIEGTEYADMALEDIIMKSQSGPVFNNSAQIWNHNFYFENLSPLMNQVPNLKILNLIHDKWGGYDQFKAEFNKMALSNFGSGWTWLVMNDNGSLEILNTSNAVNPVIMKEKKYVPLLTCDVWEHAYYIDYRNRRGEYMENFWKIVNWRKVEERMG